VAEEKNSLSKKRVIKAGHGVEVHKYILPSAKDAAENTSVSPLSMLDLTSLGNVSGSAEISRLSLTGSLVQVPAELPSLPGDPATIAAAEREAETIRSEAKAVLEKAKKEAERIQAEAREKGYAEGTAHAHEEASKELLPILQNLKETHKKLSGLKNTILKQNEVEIIDLALDIARKVIGAELSENPLTVATVIRSALNRIDLTENITVKISPPEYELLMRNVPDYLKNTWIVADSKVTRGGAVIETENGTFDARIENQLEEIEKNLKKDIVGEEGS
jgi:flagellar assembly protein FliH